MQRIGLFWKRLCNPSRTAQIRRHLLNHLLRTRKCTKGCVLLVSSRLFSLTQLNGQMFGSQNTKRVTSLLANIGTVPFDFEKTRIKIDDLFPRSGKAFAIFERSKRISRSLTPRSLNAIGRRIFMVNLVEIGHLALTNSISSLAPRLFEKVFRAVKWSVWSVLPEWSAQMQSKCDVS